MARRKTGKKEIALLVALVFLAPLGAEAIGKIPYRPQWVSVVRKGRLFKYKRKEFSSPRILGDWIYVGADAGYLYAMKKKNGRKVWRFRTAGGVNSAPAFSEDGTTVFIGDDKGVLYAISREQGRELWRTELGSEILTEPAVSGGRLFVTTLEGKVACLSASDGHILWEREHELPGFTMTVRGNTPPVLDREGGRLFAGFSDGTLWALSPSDGKPAWEKRLGGAGEKAFHDVDGAPLIEGDRLFVALFEGGLFALSKKTGQVLWSRDLGSGVRFASSAEALYVSGSDGRLHALNKKDGQTLWESKVGKEALTAPVLYKDLIAVGLSGSTMNFIRASDGKVLAHRFARKGVFSDPVIDGDRIYYLSNGGRLYSLKLVD